MARGVGEITGEAALGCVGGLALALLVTAAAFWLRARSLRRQAAGEHASLHTDPLRLAAGVVALAGTVEAPDGHGPPVSVVIEERDLRGTWREVGRVVDARPFVLRLACGTGVRVEPGPAPRLHDALEPVEVIDRDHRRRCAQLVAGERVFVRGELRVLRSAGGIAAYRTTAEHLVLAAPRRRPMLLSTEALSGALERRASDHAGMGLVLTLALAAVVLFYIDVCVGGPIYLVAGGAAPAISGDAFFWVALISGSAILGSVLSAWQDRPWYTRRGTPKL